jgi:hypothetical protein
MLFFCREWQFAAPGVIYRRKIFGYFQRKFVRHSLPSHIGEELKGMIPDYLEVGR